MNTKLFRSITLVVTVLIALAITAPALAEPPVNSHGTYEDDFHIGYCGTDEIRLYQKALVQQKYFYDENGELIDVFFHETGKYHFYNAAHPEVYLNGMYSYNIHFQKVDGVWSSGILINIHAPDFPQFIHVSGIDWENVGDGLDHGRSAAIDVDACVLLTP